MDIYGKSSSYDVVFECDFPHELPSFSRDMWSRGMQLKISSLFDGDPDVNGVRVVRTHDHVLVSVQVASFAGVGSVVSTVLSTICGDACGDVSVKVHENQVVVV